MGGDTVELFLCVFTRVGFKRLSVSLFSKNKKYLRGSTQATLILPPLCFLYY